VSPLALGLDFGSSGLRLALIDADGQQLADEQTIYGAPFEDPEGWRQGLIELVSRLPRPWRSRVGALALDGTSGTLLLCRPEGALLEGDLALALPYHLACPEQASAAAALVGTGSEAAGPAASASGSLARALRLLERAREAGLTGSLLLRHQADWLMGWLLGDWRWGEEGNNLRLGWDPQRGRWWGHLAQQSWSEGLPRICASGSVPGLLGPTAAAALGLPRECRVVAGSTDANAGVLAADPEEGDGVTVLGTTLVLKQFVEMPINAAGVSCHRVAGQWLAGGASNAGAGILRRFFSDALVAELSRQIVPERSSGLALLPLTRPGERFPVDDPGLEPVLGPRPVSDALYLHALLEGLTAIEVQGWQRLRDLGAPPLRRVLTLGGGARNPQWRTMRQLALGVPVLNRPQCSAALGMARLARSRMAAALLPPT
jgi:sugar (pentulose or hexulose) kinase